MLPCGESDEFIHDWLLGRFNPAIRSTPKPEPMLLHHRLRLARPRDLVLRACDSPHGYAGGLLELLAQASLRAVALGDDLRDS